MTGGPVINTPTDTGLTEAEKKPLEIPKRHDTFRIWMEAQGIPIVPRLLHRGDQQSRSRVLGFERRAGLFRRAEGTGGLNDGYICEIPPGGKTKPMRHLFEEMIYVSKGHGMTTVGRRMAASIRSNGGRARSLPSRSTPITSISTSVVSRERAITPSPIAASS